MSENIDVSNVSDVSYLNIGTQKSQLKHCIEAK